MSEARQLLIGAYFTMEYSVEPAALFNPSMVLPRNQSGLPEGSTRFAMSLRATGEGHVSSIVFLRGLIDKNCNIFVDERSPFLRPLRVTIQPRQHEVWRQTLIAAGALSKSASKILSGLPEVSRSRNWAKRLKRRELGLRLPAITRRRKKTSSRWRTETMTWKFRRTVTGPRRLFFQLHRTSRAESRIRASCGSWMRMFGALLRYLHRLQRVPDISATFGIRWGPGVEDSHIDGKRSSKQRHGAFSLQG
jgi:hypothetical protein